MTRSEQIDTAVTRIAERVARDHCLTPYQHLEYWLEDGTAPVGSIRNAFGDLVRSGLKASTPLTASSSNLERT